MNFIFACIYKIASINRSEKEAAWFSIYHMTLLMTINIESIIIFIGRCFFSIHHHGLLFFIIVAFAVLMLNYLLFIYKMKFIDITQQYKISYFKGTVCYIAYFIVTFAIVIAAAYYKHDM